MDPSMSVKRKVTVPVGRFFKSGLLRRLGLPDSRIYDLRHLNITYNIAEGVDPVTVASRVGHKDIAYMMRRYAHPVRAAQERAVAVCSTLVAQTRGLAR